MRVLFVFAIVALMAACQPPPQDEAMVQAIADCLGTGPSWDEIYTHFYTDAFQPGMSKEEVHQVLDCFGSWSIVFADEPDQGIMDWETKQMVYREEIEFSDRKTHEVMKKWSFLYDENGELVRVDFVES